MSVPTSTTPKVESDHVVDSGDAAIQALLALTAENIDDDEKREKPLTEWPLDCREKLWETCQYIKDLAHHLRQRNESLPRLAIRERNDG
jgi:hypothetical protein